jgi:hypothetical protein
MEESSIWKRALYGRGLRMGFCLSSVATKMTSIRSHPPSLRRGATILALGISKRQQTCSKVVPNIKTAIVGLHRDGRQ